MSAVIVPTFEQHVARRQGEHEQRVHGLPLEVAIGEALEAAADIGVRARLAGAVLERHDDLDEQQREEIADALRQAETLALAAWRHLHDALRSVQQHPAPNVPERATEPPRAAGAPQQHARRPESRSELAVSAQEATR
jgi:hypothetical protein